jgi:hypothetical protein
LAKTFPSAQAQNGPEPCVEWRNQALQKNEITRQTFTTHLYFVGRADVAEQLQRGVIQADHSVADELRAAVRLYLDDEVASPRSR